jgi:NADH-quinone oxidoreductase subunit I
MIGLGIFRGLWITFKHFIDTYLEDLTYSGKRYRTPEGIQRRLSAKTKGIFTIQYPEEKMPVPEEFRYIPFLVYEDELNGDKHIRCTSCGICAKVCPPQCIWIERGNDPLTGKPIPAPKAFFIDVDICMNCGLCAEFCPFDAIKMDHNYEIASLDRIRDHIYDLNKLSMPVSYYANIRPTNSAREEAARALKASRKSGADIAG